MDLLDLLLGRNKKTGDGGLDGLIGKFSRWIFTCGCLLALGVVGLIALVVGGIVDLGADAATIVIVFATIVVAVVSLIRASLGY